MLKKIIINITRLNSLGCHDFPQKDLGTLTTELIHNKSRNFAKFTGKATQNFGLLGFRLAGRGLNQLGSTQDKNKPVSCN